MDKIFKPKDRVIVQTRRGTVETFITKVVTSEYIDADGETITTHRVYYADATGGMPLDKGITAVNKESSRLLIDEEGTQTC